MLRGVLKNQPMIILGCTMVTSFSLATLATTTVLSTRSQTESMDADILAESISGRNESLDLKWTVKDAGELHLKVTGRNTTVAVQSVMRMLRSTGSPLF